MSAMAVTLLSDETKPPPWVVDVNGRRALVDWGAFRPGGIRVNVTASGLGDDDRAELQQWVEAKWRQPVGPFSFVYKNART